jgi:hypothetical protein
MDHSEQSVQQTEHVSILETAGRAEQRQHLAARAGQIEMLYGFDLSVALRHRPEGDRGHSELAADYRQSSKFCAKHAHLVSARPGRRLS